MTTSDILYFIYCLNDFLSGQKFMKKNISILIILYQIGLKNILHKIPSIRIWKKKQKMQKQ